MFDTINFAEDQPNGPKAGQYQTKDLPCNLDIYHVIDGELCVEFTVLVEDSEEKEKNAFWDPGWQLKTVGLEKCPEVSGKIVFYWYRGEPGGGVEWEGTFEKGRVVSYKKLETKW